MTTDDTAVGRLEFRLDGMLETFRKRLIDAVQGILIKAVTFGGRVETQTSVAGPTAQTLPAQVESPNGVNAQTGQGGALIINNETLGKGVAALLIGAVIFAALLAGVSITFAIVAQMQVSAERSNALAREAEARARSEQALAALQSRFEAVNTEARMAEYYILELDGKLMAGGFIPPSRGYGQWKAERSKK
jgi:hypothetical protein